MDHRQLTEDLIRIGIDLTSQRDVQGLLEGIVQEAMNFTRAEAGSLYVAENGTLRFAVAHNRALEGRGFAERVSTLRMPVDHTSLAGYVAASGEVVNLPDVEHIPEHYPFRSNRSVDRDSGYRTRSALTIPLRDPSGTVLGVLQLLNALNAEGRPGPFPSEVEPLAQALASFAAVGLKNALLTEALKETHYRSIVRLATAAEYRDPDTAQHLERMSHYARIVARRLGWSEDQLELILYASPMHDIGKLGVPDAILRKPGPLTDDERTLMERHTVIGGEILSAPDSPLLEMSRQIALTHHEKFDGGGYPLGLVGEAIPRVGRIVAVADVFDALTSPRCYKPRMLIDEAAELIRRGRGGHFEPDVVDAFESSLEEIAAALERLAEPTPAGGMPSVKV